MYFERLHEGEFVKYLNRSANIITTNTEYTIDPQRKTEETTLYYIKTLEVGQHHTMDPIMEGILSCSLASSRGHPPIELPLQIQYFSSCLITLLEPLYIVLPSPKNILEEGNLLEVLLHLLYLITHLLYLTTIVGLI
jgi:hypothetical protein